VGSRGQSLAPDHLPGRGSRPTVAEEDCLERSKLDRLTNKLGTTIKLISPKECAKAAAQDAVRHFSPLPVEKWALSPPASGDRAVGSFILRRKDCGQKMRRLHMHLMRNAAVILRECQNHCS